MASTLVKAVIAGGVLTGIVLALKRARHAHATTIPSATKPPIGQTGAAKSTPVDRTPIPAPVLVPRDPGLVNRAAAVTQMVLNSAAVDRNGNLLDVQAYVNDLAAALDNAGITFRTPTNAAQITQHLAAVITDPRIALLPVVEDNPHLATPPEASTTGIVLVPGPESGTDRVQIIMPLSGGWPDVQQYPNGSNITLTGAGYVVELPR